MAEDRQGFMKLTAWQKADELASAVFHVAQQIPAQHRWLSSQITRAAISVPANIAEGYGRGAVADYARFLDIARGSLSEVEYYIHFLGKESLVADVDLKSLTIVRTETGRVLHGLWQSLKTRAASGWDRTGRALKEVAEEPYAVE